MFLKNPSLFREYKTILEPDENSPNWWAGAPSVVRSKDTKIIYLAARMREGKSQRGRRGYEVRVLKSKDGEHFEVINHIHRDKLELPVVERPCIVQIPTTGKFRLYGSSEFIEGWGIWKLDDVKDPVDFDPTTVERVLVPELPQNDYVRVSGYKDPFIFWDNKNNFWHMFIIGVDRVERPYHFTSEDGISWKQLGTNPVMESTGWHNFFTRPACIIQQSIGYLLVYEGSNLNWTDPVYNIATGIAYSPDLQSFYDITPIEPLIKSTTPGKYHTWRYSHWLTIPEKNEFYVYYEAARPNDTNEIRLSILKY
jgi:hypothetical protein